MWLLHVLRGGDCVGRKKNKKRKETGWKEENRISRWRGYFVVVTVWEGTKQQTKKRSGKEKIEWVVDVATSCTSWWWLVWEKEPKKTWEGERGKTPELSVCLKHRHCARRWSYLARAAIHCSNSTHCNDTLQRVHLTSYTLQHTATHCSNSTHCNNTLQRVHLMSYTLQHTAKLCAEMRRFDIWCTSEYTHTHRHTQPWHVSRLF